MENTKIRKVWIYALKDPRNNEIRYIGKSINPLKRFKDHIYQRNFENTRKSNWIKKIIKLGMKPILEILKETDETEYKHWEEFFIKENLDKGVKLTNYDEAGIGTCNGMKRKTIERVKKKLSKKVYQYDLNGNFVKEYNSLRDAERQTSINHGNISKCCKKIYSHVGDYIFSLEKNVVISPIVSKKAQKKKVLEIDKNGAIIREYASIGEAARQTGIDASNISRVCNKKKKNTYNRYFIFE